MEVAIPSWKRVVGNGPGDETGNGLGDETGNGLGDETGNEPRDETGNEPEDKDGSGPGDEASICRRVHIYLIVIGLLLNLHA